MGTDWGGEDKKKMGKGMDWCEEEKKKDEGVGLGRERPEKLGRGGGGSVETYLGFRFSSFNPLPAEEYVPVKQFSLKTIVPKTMYR